MLILVLLSVSALAMIGQFIPIHWLVSTAIFITSSVLLLLVMVYISVQLIQQHLDPEKRTLNEVMAEQPIRYAGRDVTRWFRANKWTHKKLSPEMREILWPDNEKDKSD